MSSAALRQELIGLLEAHRSELEDKLAARLRSTDLGVSLDDETLAALRPIAAESVNTLISSLEEGSGWSPSVPPVVARQVRVQVRRGISLEAVLRAFSVVATVFFEFLAERLDDLSDAQDAVRFAVSIQSHTNDGLMNVITAIYSEEMERLDRAPSRRLAQQIERLLAGGPGIPDLPYRIDACHIGLVALGADAEVACKTLAERMGCDLLSLPRTDDTVWAWLGAPRQLGFGELERQVGNSTAAICLAAGEPRDGVDGWRLTHREAQAALAIARLEGGHLTRFSDVALLADALRNEATGRSLVDRYLSPLDRHRDGERLRTTLHTYLDLDCNAASAAAALHVDRHTVQRRLKRVEVVIGEAVSDRRAELDVALRLERLTAADSRQSDLAKSESQ